MKILVSCIFLPFCVIGQTTYKGQIINSRTRESIPFATIALINENIGTNADENGKFDLVSRFAPGSDSLLISCVGFESKKVIVHEFISNNIELEERISRLQEIKIFNKVKWEEQVLNSFSGNGNVGFSTDGSHTQVAKLFTAPQSNTILTEVKISKRNYSFRSHKAIFRLRIYDIDTITGTPSIDLCDEIIEINSTDKIVKVNLEKYKVRIPNKAFFIAVEWLKIPFNEDRNNDRERNVEYISYRPSLQADNNFNFDAESQASKAPCTIWVLNYKKEWQALPSFRNVYISATIRF